MSHRLYTNLTDFRLPYRIFHLLLLVCIVVSLSGCVFLMLNKTPLTKAAGKGDAETVRSLIKAGADVNKKDDWGSTALESAAYWGHIDVARILLDNGANSNIGSPLVGAVTAGHLDIAELLLRRGCDANQTNQAGDTALMWAAGKGYTHMVRLLLEHGANIKARNNVGTTALSLAESKRHKEIVQMLVVFTNTRPGVAPLRVLQLAIPDIQGEMAGNPTTNVRLQLKSVPGNSNMYEFSGKMEFVLEGLDFNKPGTTQNVGAKNTAWFAGAEHTIAGTVRIQGWTFRSDQQVPLVFQLVNDKGYVYQGGHGTVISPKGQVFELGQ